MKTNLPRTPIYGFIDCSHLIYPHNQVSTTDILELVRKPKFIKNCLELMERERLYNYTLIHYSYQQILKVKKKRLTRLNRNRERILQFLSAPVEKIPIKFLKKKNRIL